MRKLTGQGPRELDAVERSTRMLGKATFVHRSNWRSGYAELRRLGLITWRSFERGEFSGRFAKVELTALGRNYLKTIRNES